MTSLDPEIARRVSLYELAFRMQAFVPGLARISDEPEHILMLYGAQPAASSFANNCLLARRLLERRVRFVELFDADWDFHERILEPLPEKCRSVDRPIAAPAKDLHQRGLLDESIVLWDGSGLRIAAFG